MHDQNIKSLLVILTLSKNLNDLPFFMNKVKTLLLGIWGYLDGFRSIFLASLTLLITSIITKLGCSQNLCMYVLFSNPPCHCSYIFSRIIPPISSSWNPMHIRGLTLNVTFFTKLPLFYNQKRISLNKSNTFLKDLFITAFCLEYFCALSSLLTYNILMVDTGFYFCIIYKYGYNMDGQ